jgi:Domain of unknown function (DUF4129)
VVGSTAKIRARDRWLAVLAVLGFAIVCVAANAARPHPRTSYLNSTSLPASRPPSSVRPVTDSSELPRSSHSHFTVPWWLVNRLVVLLLLGVAAVLVILLIIWLVPRLQFRRVRRRPAEDEPVVYAPAVGSDQVSRQVSDALDDTLAALRRGDRQRAVIACWIRLEQIAEEAGFARLSSETSSELAGRWLDRLPVSQEPLLALAELYREARYSSHRLPDSALEAARAALEQLRREIAASTVRGLLS